MLSNRNVYVVDDRYKEILTSDYLLAYLYYFLLFNRSHASMISNKELKKMGTIFNIIGISNNSTCTLKHNH